MKTINKYIQFAIDNGYKIDYEYVFSEKKWHIWETIINKDIIDKVINRDINWTLNFHSHIIKNKSIARGSFSVIEAITSKPFIEAIAKGKISNTFIVHWEIEGDYLDKISDKITLSQAIAIRDNKLEEFINSLLPNE